MRVTPLPDGLCVVGLGLIGGSVLRAAAPHLPVFGWAPGPDGQAAAADGFDIAADLDTALRRAADTDALVVLAAPVTAFSTLLTRIDEIAPRVRLTDVGGVKARSAVHTSELQ